MSKGKRREREAAKMYEAAGYDTFSPQESKWGETDMFGLFDILAMPTEDTQDDRVRLAQVKSNRAGGIIDWFDECRDRFGPAVAIPEFLVCYDREGWRLDGLSDMASYETFVDEREMDCGMGEGVTEYLQEAEYRVERKYGVKD